MTASEDRLTDSDRIREAASWLDTYDKMAEAWLTTLAGSQDDEVSSRAAKLAERIVSSEVQDDLRRIADDLEAHETREQVVDRTLRILWGGGTLQVDIRTAKSIVLSFYDSEFLRDDEGKGEPKQ